jgi:hypothetical protein
LIFLALRGHLTEKRISYFWEWDGSPTFVTGPGYDYVYYSLFYYPSEHNNCCVLTDNKRKYKQTKQDALLEDVSYCLILLSPDMCFDGYGTGHCI